MVEALPGIDLLKQILSPASDVETESRRDRVWQRLGL